MDTFKVRHEGEGLLNELCWGAFTVMVVVVVRTIAIRFKLRLARP